MQDQFQIQFWKTRQAEYEPYLLQYSPIRVRQASPALPFLLPLYRLHHKAAATIEQLHDVAAEGERYYRVT